MSESIHHRTGVSRDLPRCSRIEIHDETSGGMNGDAAVRISDPLPLEDVLPPPPLLQLLALPPPPPLWLLLLLLTMAEGSRGEHDMAPLGGVDTERPRGRRARGRLRVASSSLSWLALPSASLKVS
mgnify:CR=1 FL=1